MSAPVENLAINVPKDTPVKISLWPTGWDAFKFGFHLTWGCMAALGLFVWIGKAGRWLGQAAGFWA